MSLVRVAHFHNSVAAYPETMRMDLIANIIPESGPYQRPHESFFLTLIFAHERFGNSSQQTTPEAHNDTIFGRGVTQVGKQIEGCAGQ